MACAAVDREALAREEVKETLRELTADINRGIFGLKIDHQAKIHSLVERLEALTPVKKPTADLTAVHGRWRLLYSTIRILGTRRSKLGLREFVKLGDLYQDIDAAEQTAVNTVEFAVAAFNMLRGALTISASYTVASSKRVNVTFDKSELAPEQLQKLFEKNYEMLLGIFNPDGWLDITYVDSEMRVGRDDKGNLFLLERAPASGSEP